MTIFHSSDKVAYFYAILAVLFWSTVASAFKLTLNYFNYVQLVGWSSFFSLLVLLIVLILQGKFGLLFNQTKKEWSKSALLGFLNPFLYYLILFRAYDLLRAQEAMVLNYTWPIVFALFSSVYLRRKVKFLGYVSLFISFCGIIIIAFKGNFSVFEFDSPLGIALALSSAVVWATFWIINMNDSRDIILKLTSGFIFGTLFAATFLALSTGFGLSNYQSILGAAYIGTFEMGLTFVLWLNAVSKTNRPEKISQLVYLSPFLSFFFISIILRERVLVSSIIGLTIIIAGILIQKRIK